MISIVIPTFQAAEGLPRTLRNLVPACACGMVREAIIADAGSSDDTREIGLAAGARVIDAPRGRGRQLAAGARAARGPWFLFLHADTVLDSAWTDEVRAFMARGDGQAAAFRFALDDEAPAARRLEHLVRWRCSLFKLPYGDQGLLIHRSLYDAVGGYSDMPLFEDVDLVRRIGRRRLSLLQSRAVTSAERFRRDGYVKRSARNLSLLARYYLGASPDALARAYD